MCNKIYSILLFYSIIEHILLLNQKPLPVSKMHIFTLNYINYINYFSNKINNGICKDEREREREREIERERYTMTLERRQLYLLAISRLYKIIIVKKGVSFYLFICQYLPVQVTTVLFSESCN